MRGPGRIVVVIGVAWLASGVGCMGVASHDQLTRRASFDLGCSERDLQYYSIDDRTRGVAGCGRHATYVSTCDQTPQGWSVNCTWMLNGAVGTSGEAPPPLPPPPPPPRTDYRE